ncbi:MAG: hypothetical protein ACLQU3_29995 [Limisphaerales bacterium]
MQSRLALYFTYSAAALLAAFSTALFLGNIAASRLVQPHDPLLGIGTNTLSWILGIGATAVLLACIYMREPRFKLALLLWFAAIAVIYRVGLQWQGVHNLGGYTGSLAHAFDLSNRFANSLLNLLLLYLFAGSAALLLWNVLAGPEEVPLKAACTHCGGHIAFSAGNLGQTVLCPHCLKETTLHKPGMLKMSCFFCKGHIEFPAYAIGEKIRCPHCKMDITLKEPA